MSADVEYASVQRFEPRGKERYLRRGGVVAERDVEVPETHVRYASSGAALLYDGVRLLVRLLVRMLYLSPLLLIPKIVFLAAGSWYSDLITIAFVLLVVVLFAGAALLVLLHLVVGPRSVRRRKSRLVFREPRQALPERTAPETHAGPISVMGRIDAGAGALPGEMVLHERWDEQPEGLARTLWVRPFAVVSEGQQPVIVEIDAAPTLLGPYAPDRLEAPPREVAQALRALGLGDLEPGAPSCTLRHGDRVELAAELVTAVPDVDEVPLGSRKLQLATDDRGGPYRGRDAVSGLIARSTLMEPVVLRRGE